MVVKTLDSQTAKDKGDSPREQGKPKRLASSEFLNRCAHGMAAGSEVERVCCEFTGAKIFAPLAGEPMLTTEAVRKMLAGFP